MFFHHLLVEVTSVTKISLRDFSSSSSSSSSSTKVAFDSLMMLLILALRPASCESQRLFGSQTGRLSLKIFPFQHGFICFFHPFHHFLQRFRPNLIRNTPFRAVSYRFEPPGPQLSAHRPARSSGFARPPPGTNDVTQVEHDGT